MTDSSITVSVCVCVVVVSLQCLDLEKSTQVDKPGNYPKHSKADFLEHKIGHLNAQQTRLEFVSSFT